ncbi:hypothetical protein AAG747_25525 [Rapidithrix thailandica]|uniref:Uncharacterized protein n=1 Tax=Rapidithrix thailandica TaxID=413964 RepID=A0AAW9SEE3_9BACT
MKELLQNIGIDNFHNFLYEYEPVLLDWWDPEHQTSIEIQVGKDEEGFIELTVFFCPMVEQIVERNPVFYTSFKEETIEGNTLIAKPVADRIASELTLEFSEEQNAYFTQSYPESKQILEELLNLLSNKTPLYTFDLNEEEEQTEDLMPENALEHFIAMLSMNLEEMNQETILDGLEMAIAFEGVEYLETLKQELSKQETYDFEKKYGIDQNALALIKKIVESYEL